MNPVFLLDVIQTTEVPALMQKNWLFFAFGIPGLTVEPPPDLRTSILHASEPDPHVFAAVHMSAGCGSSQTYLLFASVKAPLSNTIDVTNATLHERSLLLMVDSSQDSVGDISRMDLLLLVG
jgi:hypothetical protein